jgi:hypothetical protein
MPRRRSGSTTHSLLCDTSIYLKSCRDKLVNSRQSRDLYLIGARARLMNEANLSDALERIMSLVEAATEAIILPNNPGHKREDWRNHPGQLRWGQPSENMAWALALHTYY